MLTKQQYRQWLEAEAVANLVALEPQVDRSSITVDVSDPGAPAPIGKFVIPAQNARLVKLTPDSLATFDQPPRHDDISLTTLTPATAAAHIGDEEIAQEYGFSRAERVLGIRRGESMLALACAYNYVGDLLEVGVRVHPDYRARGFGKSVVGALLSSLASDGIDAVNWITLADNAASIALVRHAESKYESIVSCLQR